MNIYKIAEIITSEYFKKEMISYLKYKLGTDKKWCLRALTVIYEQQTNDERVEQVTKELNNVGFTGTDASVMTNILLWYKEKEFITSKQLSLCFRIMPKYARQIYERIPSFDKSKLEKIMDNDKEYQEKKRKENERQDKMEQGIFDLK